MEKCITPLKTSTFECCYNREKLKLKNTNWKNRKDLDLIIDGARIAAITIRATSLSSSTLLYYSSHRTLETLTSKTTTFILSFSVASFGNI